MRSADDIRRLFRNAELRLRPDGDERVFADVLQARQKMTENLPALPASIWRIIMKNRITEFAAAVTIAIVVLLPLSYGATKFIRSFIAIRQLPAIKLDLTVGALSPDGKHFAGITYGEELVVIDTSTGQQRKLAEKCKSDNLVWSADGSEIAVISSAGEKRTLLAVSLKTGKTRILFEDPRMYLLDWSSDRRLILGYESRTNVDGDTMLAFLVNLETKKKTVLGENMPRWSYEYWSSPEFSPKGDLVIYVTRESGRSILHQQKIDGTSHVKYTDFQGEISHNHFSPKGDLISYVTHEEAGRSILHLQKIDGTSHVRYTDFPGEIGKCLWSPDSTYVVFTGTQKAIEQIDTDLWALRVQGSKFVGEPALLVPGVEQMRLLSWSQNGQLAYATSYDFGGLFTLPVDLQTGKATGAPRRSTRLCNLNCRCWSPDGKKIAWCTFYSEKGGEGINIISAVSGEKIRGLPSPGYDKTGGGMSWSPDGKFIAHAGMDKEKRAGVLLITVETGDIKLLVLPQGEGGGAEEVVGNITWSADSKSIAYGCNGDVYVVNIEDGKPRRLTSPTEKDEAKRTQFFIRPAFAPDGGSVAYTVVNCQKSDAASSSYNDSQSSDTLLATTIDGKETREIVHWKNGKILVFDWSPDGRHIVFTPPGNKEIWCAATDGGEPFRIADLSNLGETAYARWPKWSPKGDVISFVVSISKNQYWVMENFLPEE